MENERIQSVSVSELRPLFAIFGPLRANFTSISRPRVRVPFAFYRRQSDPQLARMTVGIDFCGARIAVSKPAADLIERDAVAQHLGRCCVAQQMRTPSGSFDAGALKSPRHHTGNAIA